MSQRAMNTSYPRGITLTPWKANRTNNLALTQGNILHVFEKCPDCEPIRRGELEDGVPVVAQQGCGDSGSLEVVSAEGWGCVAATSTWKDEDMFDSECMERELEVKLSDYAAPSKRQRGRPPKLLEHMEVCKVSWAVRDTSAESIGAGSVGAGSSTIALSGVPQPDNELRITSVATSSLMVSTSTFDSSQAGGFYVPSPNIQTLLTCKRLAEETDAELDGDMVKLQGHYAVVAFIAPLL
eukprot:2670820-Amphidinium_carterae.3